MTDQAGHGDLLNRSNAVLVVTIILISLSSAFVWLRMLSRGVIVKKITPDDWIILLAWVLAVGLSFLVCFGTTWGLGRHEVEVPTEWLETLRSTEYAFSLLYQPALMATKSSILAFYLSLSKANHVFRWACIGTLFAVNAGGLALTFVTAFQCHPVDAVFDISMRFDAQCTDILTIYLASVPLNLITDLALLFLPMPILTSMRLPSKQKIILIITFSFGAFVAAIDVVRISSLQSAAELRLKQLQAVAQAEGDGAPATRELTDSSWYLALAFMWSAVEVNVGIMCACVPGLKPLVARFLPALLRSVGDQTSKMASSSEPVADIRANSEPLPNIRANSPPASPKTVHFSDHGRSPSQCDGPMGMLDFLTTPNMDEMAGNDMERTNTAQTNTSRHTAPEEPKFFDFVDMQQKKTLAQMTNRQSVFPIGVVTLLFFIWGFEYGLLAALNQEFQIVAHVTPGQMSAIHSAYFAGYFAGPITIGWLILKHWGFKACFPIGLSIYAAGLLIFWPAAVLASWPTFVVSNFIAGFGLSVLEVSANPWIFLCGPAEYGEIRLNLSQAVQAIGSIVAPLIADKAFFGKSNDAPSLVNTQWAYLGISLATALLALVYYYVPIPEASDAELEDAVERLDGANLERIKDVRIIWIVLALGVFGQFCYVGAQEVSATQWTSYLEAVAPRDSSREDLAIAHTAFAVSRFLSAGLGFWCTPRIQLVFFSCGLVIFQVLAMNYTGMTGVAMIIMVYFMEGPLFALIFSQALRGMGKHTKFASVLITSAISGGAVFPPISSYISADTDRGSPYSLVVGVAAAAGVVVFALWLNASRKTRKLVDPIRAKDMAWRLSSNESRASRALSFLSLKKKLLFNRECAVVEYREHRASI